MQDDYVGAHDLSFAFRYPTHSNDLGCVMLHRNTVWDFPIGEGLSYPRNLELAISESPTTSSISFFVSLFVDIVFLLRFFASSFLYYFLPVVPFVTPFFMRQSFLFFVNPSNLNLFPAIYRSIFKLSSYSFIP